MVLPCTRSRDCSCTSACDLDRQVGDLLRRVDVDRRVRREAGAVDALLPPREAELVEELQAPRGRLSAGRSGEALGAGCFRIVF